MRASALATAAALLVSSVRAIDPIVIKGSKFFYKTNQTQFYIKGVAYQQSVIQSGSTGNAFSDPLADPTGCARDLPYLQRLETNVVRVYSVDPSADHSECMSMFANAGIYALVDLGSPNMSIESGNPSWTVDLFARYQQVVDTFAQYDNTLGFFAGNEVVFNQTYADAAPFVKAATRDTKAYIKSKGYRQIGVGYATLDDPAVLAPISEYLNCGDSSATIDFFGFNVYSWCGDSSFTQSGYAADTSFFSSYSVPVFLSEYGCNTVLPRTFGDTPVIYGPEMDGVWSGGIVYEWFNQPGSGVQSNYGLVSVASGSSSISLLPAYSAYSSQIASVSPTIVTASNYSPTNSAQSCPTPNSNFSVAVASGLPPTPNVSVCNCMYSSLACRPAKAANQSEYGDLFSYVCGQNSKFCAAISANGTTGQYGQYSGCSSVEQLGWVLNQYYLAHGSQSGSCDFSGSAVLVAATPTGSCSAVLSSASAGYTGAGSSSAASTSGSKAAAPINTVYGASNSGLAMAMLLVPVAFVSGIGMLAL